ncbi:leucine-rich repeat protein [Capnocytophaga canimorsus]|uniref:leucine-rich repeat protein n=1 Tax=Capnocytophaga canimorsus TaxID=28188 RepID=UPI0037D91429
MNVLQNFVWGNKKNIFEETILEITTTAPNQTFEWKNVQGGVKAYDWDNGIVNKSNTHTFQGAGTYTIKIIGNISHFRANSSLVTKIIKVASTIRDFSWTFYNCTNLTSIPTGLFNKNVNVTFFFGCFYGCSNLTSIPTGLFDKNVNVTNFTACFYNCTNLTSIPTGLFDKNVNVTSFSSCFYNCTNLTSIPTGLFDKNVNVKDFSHCFYFCTNLTSIPTGLFDKNVNVTDFTGCFYGCSNLTSIPTGLFDKNVNVTFFSSCFYFCRNLTNRPKPHNLEMWQIAGTNGRPTNINISNMFRNCISMPDYNNLPNSVK